MNKAGQIAIYVIAAVVIVAGVALYFIFREGISEGNIPAELEEVYDYYESCIWSETQNALDLAGSQGGRIDTGEYAPASEYAPFASHLNFLGFPVKHWYYISASGVIKEDVPTKAEIEAEIADFVEEGLIGYCDFEQFYARGYEIEKDEPEVRVEIQDNEVNVEVNSVISISKGEESARKVSHSAKVDSKFGKFYSIARQIYERERSDAIFEQYAVDVLRLYAPVDGVEIQCAPKIWSTQEVMSEIRSGLDNNFRTIKFEGGEYEISDKEREYFVIDDSVSESVNVIYSSEWPTRIEVDGHQTDDEVMIAETVGTEEGMGILGFCYVPYHFVYDLSFPILVQVYDGTEIFQFSFIGIVDNNVPRMANFGERVYGAEEEFDLCEFSTQKIEVNLYDSELNSVDGNLSYECFSQRCRLGETTDGKWNGFAPACVNGFVNARAEGFADKKQRFSSNEEIISDILMEREREVEVEVLAGGQDVEGGGTALISFVRDDGYARTVVYPEVKSVKLAEGSYEISAYVYSNSSITIPASTKVECFDVPRGGILGIFGSKKEKCVSIEIPATKVDYGLSGGGKGSDYFVDSELAKGRARIEVDKFSTPRSLDELASNFEKADTGGVYVYFE